MGAEATFKRWLIQKINAEDKCFAQSIETMTGAGIPDVFVCIRSTQMWIELKASASCKPYMRISQFRWFLRQYRAGGRGLLLIKNIKDKSIDGWFFDNFARYSDAHDCVLKDKDIYFPDNIPRDFTIQIGDTKNLTKEIERLNQYWLRRQQIE